MDQAVPRDTAFFGAGTTRVHATPAAAALLRAMRRRYGAVLLHLSAGCCEGSTPMCLRVETFRVGARDVKVAEVEGCPFYIGAAQMPYWTGFDITLDVITGGGDSFSLEAPDGVRFTVSSQARHDAAPPS